MVEEDFYVGVFSEGGVAEAGSGENGAELAAVHGRGHGCGSRNVRCGRPIGDAA